MRIAAWPRTRFFHATTLLVAIAIVDVPRWTGAAAPAAVTSALKQGNARVVFVGDSITGLSRNYPTGFAHQIQWALQAVYPQCKPDLVSLGGSGQGVSSWRGVAKRARQEEFFLDVRGVGVKAALDRPADVLVVMLGMNDVLAPYVSEEAASLDRWTEDYRALIGALKECVKPGIVALATVTMCTEDPTSPKNRMIDRLNHRLGLLAEQLGCQLLRTGERMQDALRDGRRRKHDFHVTYDFVHPNDTGHTAIAAAILQGLGEAAALKSLLARKPAEQTPSLSYEWLPVAGPLRADRHTFRVHYWWDGGKAPSNRLLRVRLNGEGWEVQPDSCQAAEGEFSVSGAADRRVNALKLEGSDGRETRHCEVKIPTPWLVTAGLVQSYWSSMRFNPANARTPVDESIARNEDFLTRPLNPTKAERLCWQRHFPSVNYTGLDSPGSVDFSAVTHARNFEAGYAVRWVYSPRERPVRVLQSVQAFAGSLYLTTYLNGQELYAGHITTEPRKQKQVEGQLRRGWNTLVFKTNHCTWQWQCEVDLAGVGEDTLDDLRYSIVQR